MVTSLLHDLKGFFPYFICTTKSSCDLLSYNDFLSQEHSTFGLESLIAYSFQTSTALGVFFTRESLVALSILVLLFRFAKSIIIPLSSSVGRNIGNKVHHEGWGAENEEKVIKFGEYIFRLFYHSSISIIGVWYFWDKEWWDNSKGGTKQLWVDYPNHPIDAVMIWYYLCQSAYNVEAMLSLMKLSFTMQLKNPFLGKRYPVQNPVRLGWNKTCRGDAREMMIHHLVTNLLIFASSHLRFTRIGSMIFLIHDISDVPVDLSKLANFLKWKTGTVVFYTIMLIMWVITRLGILPFVIFKSILIESSLLVISGSMSQYSYDVGGTFFVLLIGILILLHLFWFHLLVNMGWRLLTKGEAHDLTEHKNGEDQGQLKGSKKEDNLSKKRM